MGITLKAEEAVELLVAVNGLLSDADINQDDRVDALQLRKELKDVTVSDFAARDGGGIRFPLPGHSYEMYRDGVSFYTSSNTDLRNKLEYRVRMTQ